MSITNALSNAVSGMSAASRRAEVTGHNIANATTEGYARQRIDSVQHVVSGRGSGVLTNPVDRATDARLTASRREADAQANGQGAQATAARNIADVYGGPGSIASRIAALETSLRGVSEAPESIAFQERAVSAASGVVSAFGTVSASIQSERTEADRGIGGAVDDVNRALEQILRLNGEIGAARSGGGDPAAFEQSRDEQIDIVAGHLSVRSMPRPNGQIALLTETGVTLVDGAVHELEFTSANLVSADMDYRAGHGPLSGLSVDGIDLTPGSATQGIGGGLIAGLFEVRDGELAAANGEVDALAADLIGRFEATGIAGADGRGLFTDGGAALVSPGQPGLAARLQINERVDPEQGGSTWRLRDGLDSAAPGPVAASGHALALLEAMTETRLSGGSLSRPASAAGLAGDLGSLFEQRGQSLEDAAALTTARRDTFQDAESAAIGVDLDTELKNLILIEQAYSANAKVIEVADRLVQRLLEI